MGIESGYARGPADVADIMRAVPAAGAIGVSIEDAQYPGEPLRAIGEQAERIAAAREAADAEGVPVFVSAGSFLHRAAPRRAGRGAGRRLPRRGCRRELRPRGRRPGDRRTPGRRRGRTDERHGRIRHPPVAEPADALDHGELNALFGGPPQ
ncbi:isocitrate lyase/phosphoenolpyruvate mutase family protein [Streptomyces canus]|uniref:isocitrate lyase/phosphoenolpyruvate mutase family protein n=1 Tax=Streptomyces canus TaxID=58343 RepID=UPI002E331B2B|nr:isocitrate lyase/phosphoenolpyruvate mutase family protein [Streptomyces canus]